MKLILIAIAIAFSGNAHAANDTKKYYYKSDDKKKNCQIELRNNVGSIVIQYVDEPDCQNDVEVYHNDAGRWIGPNVNYICSSFYGLTEIEGGFIRYRYLCDSINGNCAEPICNTQVWTIFTEKPPAAR